MRGRRFLQYLPHYFRYRFTSSDFANYDANAGARSGMDRVLGALISAAQHSGELRQDLSVPLLTTLFQHLYLAVLMRWLAVSDVDLKKEIVAMIDVFVNGAAHRPRRKKP